MIKSPSVAVGMIAFLHGTILILKPPILHYITEATVPFVMPLGVEPTRLRNKWYKDWKGTLKELDKKSNHYHTIE